MNKLLILFALAGSLQCIKKPPPTVVVIKKQPIILKSKEKEPGTMTPQEAQNYVASTWANDGVPKPSAHPVDLKLNSDADNYRQKKLDQIEKTMSQRFEQETNAAWAPKRKAEAEEKKFDLKEWFDENNSIHRDLKEMNELHAAYSSA